MAGPATTAPPASRLSLRKKLAFVFVFLLVVAGFVGGGTLLGYHLALRKFERTIRRAARGSTFDSVLVGATRATLAPAYLDPEGALQGMDSYAWVVPNVPAPFVGHAPRPGVHEGAVINSSMFRHAGEIAMPKPRGTVRIFLTGGSTAFGFGAPSQERTISGYLQALLDRHLAPRTNLRYEVINAANCAWSSTHERIWIENRLRFLEPDLVIALSGVNDVHWGIQGRDVRWFRSYSDEEYWRLIRLAYEAAGREVADVVAITEERVPVADVAERLIANVKMASAALRHEGARYVFALQPVLQATKKELSGREQEYRDRESFGSGTTAYYRDCYLEVHAVLSGAESGGLLAVDLADVFDELGRDDEVFLDSYHFGDRGNAILARGLFARLTPFLGPHAAGDDPVSEGTVDEGPGMSRAVDGETTNAR